MSAEQILDYPIDKIRLLARYASEEEAAQNLILVEGISLAIGSIVSKEVGRNFEEYMSALQKDAGLAKSVAKRPQSSIGMRDQLIKDGLAKPIDGS